MRAAPRGPHRPWPVRTAAPGLPHAGRCRRQRACRRRTGVPLRVRELVQQLLALIVDELGEVVEVFNSVSVSWRARRVAICSSAPAVRAAHGRARSAHRLRSARARASRSGLASPHARPSRAPCGRSGGLGGFELQLDIARPRSERRAPSPFRPSARARRAGLPAPRSRASVTVASRVSASPAARSMTVNCSRNSRAGPGCRASCWRSARSRRSACVVRLRCACSASARRSARLARGDLTRPRAGKAVALGEALRGGRGASAAGENPSQRHRSPARKRAAGRASGGAAARPFSGATTPICSRRRESSGGASTCATAVRRRRARRASARAASIIAQCTGALGAAGASRSSPRAAPSAAS